jgi:hypothetical protein
MAFSALAALQDRRTCDVARAQLADRAHQAAEDARLERLWAAVDREAMRDVARARTLPPERISPVFLLLSASDAEKLAADRSRPFVRRCWFFLMAATSRGRGRLPNALRLEAQRLNRAERLLAVLRRGPRDPRQKRFAFMESMPLLFGNDWARAFLFRRTVKSRGELTWEMGRLLERWMPSVSDSLALQESVDLALRASSEQLFMGPPEQLALWTLGWSPQ